MKKCPCCHQKIDGKYECFHDWLNEHYSSASDLSSDQFDSLKECWNAAVETCCDFFVEQEGVDYDCAEKFIVK